MSISKIQMSAVSIPSGFTPATPTLPLYPSISSINYTYPSTNHNTLTDPNYSSINTIQSTTISVSSVSTTSIDVSYNLPATPSYTNSKIIAYYNGSQYSYTPTAQSGNFNLGGLLPNTLYPIYTRVLYTSCIKMQSNIISATTTFEPTTYEILNQPTNVITLLPCNICKAWLSF